jgi:hypothetical protein
VRNSHEAAIATAIRNESMFNPSFMAKPAAIGPMSRTVAALLSMGVIIMVATNTRASMAMGGRLAPATAIDAASNSASPVVFMASVTGMRAAMSTMIEPSMAWYMSVRRIT